MINLHIYGIKRPVCLSVYLFGLEPKLLDGFKPNLAWATPFYLWVTSKYFFGLPPPRTGIILEKLKNPNFPHMVHMEGGIFSRHYLLYLTSNPKVYSLARVLFSKIYNFYLQNFLIQIILPFFNFEQEYMGILKRFFKTLR